VVVFYPYLFHPTVEGVKRVSGRAVLHPAAHDEPAVYLPVFEEVFESADLLIYHTDSEASFVNEHFRVGSTPSLTLGLGSDSPPVSIDRSLLRRWSLESRPYALCLGRVDGHKGTSMVGSYFINYQNLNGGELALVMAGPKVVDPGDHSDLIVTGPVSEEEKWALIEGASFLVQPSYFESYSIVLFEAWSLGKAVLVNAACEVTRRHVSESGGGLSFSTYPSFEVAFELLSHDGQLRSEFGRRGHQYSQERSWDRVLDRYVTELEQRFRR
jgi:glycosyltransferase involved in cell wall biosynthesis